MKRPSDQNRGTDKEDVAKSKKAREDAEPPQRSAQKEEENSSDIEGATKACPYGSWFHFSRYGCPECHQVTEKGAEKKEKACTGCQNLMGKEEDHKQSMGQVVVCTGCHNLMRMVDDREGWIGQAISCAGRRELEGNVHAKEHVIQQMVRALFGDDEEAYETWAERHSF